MKKNDDKSGKIDDLRRRAEARFAESSPDAPDLTPEKVQELLHELRTHKIELEMQNEELRRAQDELIESRDRYSNLYDFAPVGYVTVSDGGLILEANLTVAAMLGVERRALINQPLSAFIMPDDQDVYYQHRRETLDSKRCRTCCLRLLRRNADPIWIEMDTILTVHCEENPTSLQTAIIDITDRKRAEEALRDEISLTEEYINSLPGLFYVFDDHRFVKWNREWNRITGYSDVELDSRYGTDFFDGTDRERIKERMEKVLHDGAADAEANLITKSGRRIPYYFTGSRRTLNGVEHIVGLGIDISGPKLAETEKIELLRRVQQAQKLESLGMLAGGIAHDFNNLLMAIMGNADLALDELSPLSPARGRIEEIEKATTRAAELANQMLAYSGRGHFVVEPIDAGELVEEMAHLLEVSKSKKVLLKYDFAPDTPAFDGDATQIRQVIMNLITNASEAIGDKSGAIHLSTGARFCDRAFLDTLDVAHQAEMDGPLPEGTYAYFRVSDTGCGIDDGAIPKIFDPFYTTKFTGRGLGMSAVLGIVRGHNGALSIQSSVGIGTTFTVLFPAHDTVACDPATDSRARADETAWHGTGTVLLVDDEKPVRTVGKQMLERLGFQVLTAQDGRAALDVFRGRAGEIVCVLLDLTMPHLDGFETFQAMERIRPDVAVILCSGYHEHDATKRFASSGLSGFIQKPFNLHILRRAMMAVLAGARDGDAPGACTANAD